MRRVQVTQIWADHVEKEDYGSRLCKGHFLRMTDIGAQRSMVV
jgi:hypothetical protein